MTAHDSATGLELDYRYAGDGTLRVDCPHCPGSHGYVFYTVPEAVAMTAAGDACQPWYRP